jgi:nucleoside-diphosphate-sugar epimerase
VDDFAAVRIHGALGENARRSASGDRKDGDLRAGQNPINFVSVHDVACFVELAVVDAGMRGMSVDIGGPDNLTFEQIADVVQRETGKSGTIRHVPLPMMRLASVMMRPFNPVLARQIAAGVVMDTADMTFDASARARAFPSIPLTSFDQVVRRDFAAM